VTEFQLSVSAALDSDEVFEARFGALWVAQGECVVNNVSIPAGQGWFLKAGDKIETSARIKTKSVRFALSSLKNEPGPLSGVLLSAPVDLPPDGALLRLDKVSFPPGATAYRHIHSGAGLRYLVTGELEVVSDMHTETATKGHAWFEPADSPVRATASKDCPETSFIRFMVIPPEYVGKPTIRFLDKSDAAKPRLQTTHRFFDEAIQVEPG